MPVKEKMVRVPKVWGEELWVVNRPEYCGKLLFLDEGASSSLHYHERKTETFFCLGGQVGLHIEGKDYMLNPFSRPKTILPREKHQFLGITEAVILEVSTEHSDDDVVRLSASQPAGGGSNVPQKG